VENVEKTRLTAGDIFLCHSDREVKMRNRIYFEQ
jgi:hypothetical protein